MSEAKVFFILNGRELEILCSPEDTMGQICQKYAFKIRRNINSLIFLYGGSLLNLNLNLKFKEQANSSDRANNSMKILVDNNENNTLICPKCGEIIKLNTESINELILSNKNIKETINGTKIIIDNIINNSTNNLVNIQLKNINIILDNINETIQKNNSKLQNLINDNINQNNDVKNSIIDIIKNNNNNVIDDISLNTNFTNNYKYKNDYTFSSYSYFKDDNNNDLNDNKINSDMIEYNMIDDLYIEDISKKENYFHNNNVIKGVLFVDLKEKPKSIPLLNTNSNDRIDIYLNKSKINMIKENDKWIIDYNFEKSGKYEFEIVFNDNITNMKCFFEKCSNIISLDFSHFNNSIIINMEYMFNQCLKLREIKGINKFMTNIVDSTYAMFQLCIELEYLDLSNFDTSNIKNMAFMFNKCYKLKEIKGI